MLVMRFVSHKDAEWTTHSIETCAVKGAIRYPSSFDRIIRAGPKRCGR